MDKFRHCCYKLGKDQDESLANCEKYDSKDTIGKSLFLAELIIYCTDKKKKDYVERILFDK